MILQHVASKIRYLQEYHNRVLHNIYPVPSGTDIANTLKYFSQTLLSILSRTGKKENQDASNLTVPMTMCLFPVPFPLTPSLRPQVSSINPTVTRSLLYSVLRDAPSERGPQSRDAQLSDYPSLDYQGLYVTLVTLLDLVPLLQHGQHDLGQSIFYTTTCLLPFLNDDILSTLPYMCIDPSLSVALGDKPPPLYLCEECSERIAGDHSEWLIDVLLPQAEISAICQKKNCSSHVRRAVVTCFSAGCCGRHGNRPVRYCKRCHSNHHSNEVGASAETHLYQTSPPPINTRECGAEELVCAVEAVISLLKEAEFHAEQREYELNRRRQLGLSSSHHSLDNTDFDNKDDDKHDQRLLSQFGIWFLVSLCTPSENTPTESLARLVAMVFQWFHSTAYMMDDEVGSLVEKLKPQFVTKWLKTVCDVRFDVMVMCLLPKPMEFARVGGYWDKSCSTVTQLKEGLNRILCLIPYNVINQSVWECIMPEWLEAIRTEVPDNQLKEFREVLSKMFDIELCPLPFSMEEMFGFISCRFTGYPSSVQEQALLWLHVSVASDPGRRVQHNMLSPFHSPFQSPFRSPMRSPFRSPFKNFGHPGGRTIDFDCEDDEMNLNCFILMFDLLLKQMELQDDGITMGLEHSLSKDIISIINNVFQAPWGGSHTCQKGEKAIECNLCQSSILCYQLACELLERLAPKEESRLVEPTDSLEDSLLSSRPEFIIGPEGEEEENPANKLGENPGNRTEPTEHAAIKNDTERKFCYQQLPVTLRLIYTIFQEMAKFEEPDILFNMLNCLKILCLHGECLYIARKDHPQFLAYIQDHMLIASLWRVVKSEFSQLSSLAVPLLLHALSLPHGADIFWTIINSNFNSKDWKMRFEAVEKVAVICRFLDIHSVTKNHLLKYSLAHAFCCFLTAVEDVNPAVATRAGLLLDTIKRPALQENDDLFTSFCKAITAVRTNVANLSDAALWKIKRARFARNRQKSVRSLRDSVKGPAESKRALSLPETLTSKIRQQSPENDNTIKDLLPEDAGIDHQTVHQLITVLMKFMAKDESSAESDISSAKAFNTVKRHLYVLLGYDQQEGCFMIAPQKMRLSTCFNAFIAGIAQVMDYNINLGKHLLPLVVQVLKYCSCPQLRHYFQQPPRCSLWSLKPHIRQMWLKALLVILYKVSVEDCSKDFSSKDSGTHQTIGHKDCSLVTLEDVTVSEELPKPEELRDFSCGSPLTLKQKRDLLQKSFALPETSLDDNPEPGTEEDKPDGPTPSSGAKTVLLKVPEDAENPAEAEKPDTSAESDSEQNPERKVEEDGAEESEFKIQIVPRQRKQRKIAVSAIQREYLDISFNILDKLGEQRDPGATKSSLLSAPSIVSMFVPAPEEFTDEQPTVMTDKCHDCGAILEEYDEETLGLAIVVLSTFIHLSPDLAAPLLLDIMQSVGSMMVPGNAAGVAKQFLRCIFHQLAPNGIFPQLFQSTIKDGTFLRTLATALMDFNELSSIAALSQLLEGLNNKKNLPAGGAMIRCLENIATFMEALPMDSPSSLWTTISNQFQTFFAKLPCVLPLKSLLEPFSKLLSFVIQNATFTLAYLVELCGLCYRAFTKERDKFYLSRSVVLELLQALKLKSPLPDTNLLLLVQCGTAAMECVRQYISEVLDFMADMHTLTKLKSHMKTCSQPLHEDTFGGHLKVGLAQIAAMEISRGNHRDNRAVIRYLPWLYHPPSAMQQGPKEFIECVSHIRLLSWLLLGSLTHNAVCPSASSPCLPIPLDAGSHIADHLIVILIGFPEQSKTSVLHMCSLFHAFIFAQLWTVYCEQSAVATNVQNQNEFSFTAILTALEFWSRVTPSILQLMAHNKVHLSAGLQLRLQAIQNNVNHHSLRTLPGSGQSSAGLAALRKWLQCTQFKMAQVEIQSSEAASQFYPL
ncbi:Protein unc-79 like protein [Tupaia chinensis]|uniref:Protein unc-79 like protein n=1 Tax=Tupaia chinensis TaxID=246437 RepID=L8Y7C6_TUPCH|nr:Protein unc-79 like protein [Tupaia chinensis]